MTESIYRAEARRAIDQAIAGLPPGAKPADRLRALRHAYPFAERRGHAYRIWLDELTKPAATPAPQQAGLFD